MTALIKKGDTIRIKDNLMEEFIRCGYREHTVKLLVDEFRGKTVKALNVYQDVDTSICGIPLKGTNEWFVTVELGCEIPLTACELIEIS